MKCVIFDCDGVLINSEEVAAQVEDELFADLGLSYTEDEKIEFFSGSSLNARMGRIEDDYRKQTGSGLPDGTTEKLMARYLAVEKTQMKAIDGVVELLTALKKAGVPFAVASNSNKEGLARKLNHAVLHDFFTPHIYSREHVAKAKPAPDVFLYAAEKLGGFKPEECIVVEDSLLGVTAGVSAAMYVIGYAGGSHRATGYSSYLEQGGASHASVDVEGVKAHMFEKLGVALKPSSSKPPSQKPPGFTP